MSKQFCRLDFLWLSIVPFVCREILFTKNLYSLIVNTYFYFIWRYNPILGFGPHPLCASSPPGPAPSLSSFGCGVFGCRSQRHPSTGEAVVPVCVCHQVGGPERYVLPVRCRPSAIHGRPPPCALPCTQRVALHSPFNCRF